MSQFKKTLQRHRHLLLLITALVGMVVQPLVHLHKSGPLLHDLVAYLLLLAVFLAIFERYRERIIGTVIALPALVANCVELTTTGTTKLAAALVYHGLIVAFIGFAVVVILRGVFRSGRIGLDQIAGAFSGYVLAGVAWGNAYVILDLTVDQSFQIA